MSVTATVNGTTADGNHAASQDGARIKRDWDAICREAERDTKETAEHWDRKKADFLAEHKGLPQRTLGKLLEIPQPYISRLLRYHEFFDAHGHQNESPSPTFDAHGHQNGDTPLPMMTERAFRAWWDAVCDPMEPRTRKGFTDETYEGKVFDEIAARIARGEKPPARPRGKTAKALCDRFSGQGWFTEEEALAFLLEKDPDQNVKNVHNCLGRIRDENLCRTEAESRGGFDVKTEWRLAPMGEGVPTRADLRSRLAKARRVYREKIKPDLDSVLRLVNCDRSTFAPTMIAGYGRGLKNGIAELLKVLALSLGED